MTRAKEEEVSLSASFIDRLGGKSQIEMGGIWRVTEILSQCSV